MQRRLSPAMATVAAISYYVTSRPLNPEMLAGASIPLVLWAVWKATDHLRLRA
jgi:hypothetical protein